MNICWHTVKTADGTMQCVLDAAHEGDHHFVDWREINQLINKKKAAADKKQKAALKKLPKWARYKKAVKLKNLDGTKHFFRHDWHFDDNKILDQYARGVALTVLDEFKKMTFTDGMGPPLSLDICPFGDHDDLFFTVDVLEWILQYSDEMVTDPYGHDIEEFTYISKKLRKLADRFAALAAISGEIEEAATNASVSAITELRAKAKP